MGKKIPKNHVLVEVDFLRYKKIAFKSGTEIIVDPTFSPEKHAQTSGIVSVVPESLYYDKEDVGCFNSVEFLTDISIKVGDKVFFHYLQINLAINQHRIIEEDGKFFIFIKYDSLFMSIRDEKVVMHNGWMLLKPVDRAVDEASKINRRLPKDRQTHDPLKGEIAFLGDPVKEYFWGNDETDEGIDVKKGDVVIYLPHSDIPLEYNMHQSLDEKYFRVQRKELLSIYLN
tara:strand:+ start:1117 stop:1803 length:687 start_codon:yes stop_codon:yes gene_type:complete